MSVSKSLEDERLDKAADVLLTNVTRGALFGIAPVLLTRNFRFVASTFLLGIGYGAGASSTQIGSIFQTVPVSQPKSPKVDAKGTAVVNQIEQVAVAEPIAHEDHDTHEKHD